MFNIEGLKACPNEPLLTILIGPLPRMLLLAISNTAYLVEL